MAAGHYTELFFLDEATALAAGHRPCAECQRARGYEQFRTLWATANPSLAQSTRPAATLIDAALHRERIDRCWATRLPMRRSWPIYPTAFLSH